MADEIDVTDKSVLQERLALTEADSEQVMRAMIDKLATDKMFRKLDHEMWAEDNARHREDERKHWEGIAQANKLVSVVNIFHWMLLCLILYKFWGLE